MKFPSCNRSVVSALKVTMVVAVCGCGQRDPIKENSVPPSTSVVDALPSDLPLAERAPTDSVPLPSPQASGPPQLVDDVVTLQRFGMAALQAGDHDAAFDVARQAMRLAPQNPEVVFLMAMTLGKQNRFPEAIRMLDQLAENTPSVRLPALGQTSEFLVQFGRYADAEKRYRSILDQVPDAAMAHRSLAQLLLRQGRRSAAREHLMALCRLGDVQELDLRSLLIGLHPFAADGEQEALQPISKLAEARIEFGRQQWELALGILQPLEQPDPETDALLGRVLITLRDPSPGEPKTATDQDVPTDSKTDVSAWLARRSDARDRFADAWYAQAALAADRGDHRSAVRCFSECVLRDPTDYQTYARLSQSLREIGLIEPSDTAKLRSEWIEQTQRIGAQMAIESERSEEQFTQLITLLDRLQRPLEVLAWRGILTAYATQWGQLSESDSERALSEISVARVAILQNDAAFASPQFLVCDIELEDFPLP